MSIPPARLYPQPDDRQILVEHDCKLAVEAVRLTKVPCRVEKMDAETAFREFVQSKLVPLARGAHQQDCH